MKLNATAEDFLRQEVPNPGRYPAVVISYEEKMSNPPTDPNKLAKWEGPSQYAEIEFRVLHPADVAGVIVRWICSEKMAAAPVTKEFVEQLGQNVDKRKGYTTDLGPNVVGKKMDVYISHKVFNGRKQGEITSFMPYSGPAVTGPGMQAGV